MERNLCIQRDGGYGHRMIIREEADSRAGMSGPAAHKGKSKQEVS